MIRPKRTLYKNNRFRSRLEARWAVFFDYLDIAFEYEETWDEVDIGIGLIDYKPDFYLSELDTWVEIKPVDLKEMKYEAHLKAKGWVKEYGNLLFLVGSPSIPKETTRRHYLISYFEKKRVPVVQDHMWWCQCPKCGRISVRPYGSIPAECDGRCFPVEMNDLFGELTEVPGHLSERIKKACRFARAYDFLR